jgi:hypothetical protein
VLGNATACKKSTDLINRKPSKEGFPVFGKYTNCAIQKTYWDISASKQPNSNCK